jgi:hypothetical protein
LPESGAPAFSGYGMAGTQWPTVGQPDPWPHRVFSSSWNPFARTWNPFARDFHPSVQDLRTFADSLDPVDFFRAQQGDPDDELRHIGRGHPLVGSSWLNRPWHAGWFVGGLIGDELIDGRVDQTDDLFGGYRIGWDRDHYWGHELRLGFSRTDLADARSATSHRISRDWFLDAHLSYYPWGDAQWRPYASAGLGLAMFRFRDEFSIEHDETLLHVPLGIGVKYLVDRWLAVRLDVMDNLAISGSGLDTMHNITYTLGIEAHFGPGTSRKYSY